MTRGEAFMRKGKCKNKQSSHLSTSAWCGLDSKGDKLKLHDMYPNPECECQKEISLSPKHFHFDGAGFKNLLQKLLKEHRLLGRKLLKPALNMKTPVIIMVLSSKTKSPYVGQGATKFLESISRGTVLFLTDMDRNGLGLKDMWFHFK